MLAHNRDAHVLVIKQLILSETIDHAVVPEDLRTFARTYYKQKRTYNLFHQQERDPLCIVRSRSAHAQTSVHDFISSTVPARKLHPCS